MTVAELIGFLSEYDLDAEVHCTLREGRARRLFSICDTDDALVREGNGPNRHEPALMLEDA